MTSAHLDIFLNMYDPDITYGRFDSAQDETMKYFNGLLNNPPEDYNWRLRNSELHIESEGVEMSGWIESGDNHGIYFLVGSTNLKMNRFHFLTGCFLAEWRNAGRRMVH